VRRPPKATPTGGVRIAWWASLVTPTNPRDLNGVHLKLDRASHHIEALRAEVDAFKQRDPAPWDFTREQRAGSGNTVENVLYAVIREPPPLEWALIIGDAIQNMRAALDHLVHELSTPAGRDSPRTAFPIYDDERSFKVNGIPKVETITGDELLLIERVQPFNSPEPQNDPLAILQKLSNRDKHRLLVPVVAALAELDSWVASENAEVAFTFLEPGAVVDGEPIVTITATPLDPAKPVILHPRAGLELQVTDTGATYRDDALGVLKTIHHHIRHTIVDWGVGRGFHSPGRSEPV
jgi:hypothetical protein